jgi:DNA-binding NarL/FixJ family response regulator
MTFCAGVTAMNPPLVTAADGAQPVVVAWVDVSDLTRECMTRAVAGAQGRFVIVPFESALDCIKASGQEFDLIVFHSHGALPHRNADVVALRENFNPARLVILCGGSTLDPSVIDELLRRGVVGFVLVSQTGIQMLVSALALVAAGGVFVPKECLLSRHDAEQAALNQERAIRLLTARETEVLQLLKQGKANKTIAYELQLSETTVKIHVRNTLRKMGSANRTQLAMSATRLLGDSAG